MPKQHLTSQFIRNLKPQGKRVEYYDQHLIKDGALKKKGVKGFLVRLTKAGNKYFYYSYWHNSTSKRYKIGSYPNIGISEARDKARELARIVNNGIDPQAEKRAQKNKEEPKTIGELAALFKKKHLPKLRPSTQSSYTARIDSIILPALKDIPVNDLQRMEIIEMLDELIFEKGEHVNANRVRAILSSMYSFGVQRGIADYNPVKTIKPLGKEQSRDRVYDESEINALWEAFEKQPEPGQSVFKILLLLGQRKGETCRMQWDDIEDGTWTIPKQHTKAKRTHYVPLSEIAMGILEGLPPNSDKSPHVFQSTVRKGQHASHLADAVQRIRELSGVTDFRIHDLRRTAATYMAEAGTERTIIGKVLNHKGLSGDSQVTARYDRYDYMKEKRQALNRWASKLGQIIEGKETKIHKIG
jgi:integrase